MDVGVGAEAGNRPQARRAPPGHGLRRVSEAGLVGKGGDGYIAFRKMMYVANSVFPLCLATLSTALSVSGFGSRVSNR